MPYKTKKSKKKTKKTKTRKRRGAGVKSFLAGVGTTALAVPAGMYGYYSHRGWHRLPRDAMTITSFLQGRPMVSKLKLD